MPAISRKHLLRVVRLIVLALVAWGLWWAVNDARDEFVSERISLRDIRWSWLMLSACLYAVGLLPMAWFWHRVLISLGQTPAALDTLRAYFIGHLGKYVPGKAMVVVLRTALIRSDSVNTSVAAISVFVETLTMMAVGAFLACVVLLWQYADRTLAQFSAIGLMSLTLVPTLPPVFRRIVRRSKLIEDQPGSDDPLAGYTIGLVAQGWVACALGWCLLGVSLWATVQSVPSLLESPVNLMENAAMLIASVSLAMVVGFLSLLPGGIGARDLVLDQFMIPQFGKKVALASTVLLRIVWLVTELVVSAILYVGVGLLRRKHQ